MAVKTVITQPAIAYASGGQINQVWAPQPMITTRIDLEITANLTTSGTPGTTQDYIWRLIRNMNLLTSYGNVFSAQDLRPLHYENKFRWGGEFVTPSAPGASATNFVVRTTLRLDFGVNPDDPFDLTGGLPGLMNAYSLQGTWGSTANLGSGYTINSGTQVQATLYGWLPGQNSAGQNDVKPKAIPFLVVDNFQPNQSSTPSLGYTAMGWETGYYLHGQVYVPVAGTYPADNRSDTALSDVGVILPGNSNQQRYYKTWTKFSRDEQRYTAADDNGATFGSPTISIGGDIGIGYLPVYKLLSTPNMFGADNTNPAVNTTTTATAVGIASGSNLNIWRFQRQYQLYTGS